MPGVHTLLFCSGPAQWPALACCCCLRRKLCLRRFPWPHRTGIARAPAGYVNTLPCLSGEKAGPHKVRAIASTLEKEFKQSKSYARARAQSLTWACVCLYACMYGSKGCVCEGVLLRPAALLPLPIPPSPAPLAAACCPGRPHSFCQCPALLIDRWLSPDCLSLSSPPHPSRRRHHHHHPRPPSRPRPPSLSPLAILSHLKAATSSSSSALHADRDARKRSSLRKQHRRYTCVYKGALSAARDTLS